MTNSKRTRSLRTNGTAKLALASLTLAFLAQLPTNVMTKTTNVPPGNGTLNTALTAADPGDVLQLEAGLYIGNETAKVSGYLLSSFLLSLPIVVQGV